MRPPVLPALLALPLLLAACTGPAPDRAPARAVDGGLVTSSAPAGGA